MADDKFFEQASMYFACANYPKFWFYKSDPNVKHNNIQCRTCVYRSNQSNGDEPLTRVGCDYILITGHMRGCPPAPNCEKYRKGKRIVRTNTFNPHGRNGFASPDEPDFVELGDGYST